VTRSGSLGQHSSVLWEAAAGWRSEPRPPASRRNPYPLALVGAAEDHLDEDRVIGVLVPSWLDVEIGQRGDQPLPLRSFPDAADGQSADRSGPLQLPLPFLKAGPAAWLRHDGQWATGLTVHSIGSLHGQAVCDHATCGG
jgi:hypothetical protein